MWWEVGAEHLPAGRPGPGAQLPGRHDWLPSDSLKTHGCRVSYATKLAGWQRHVLLGMWPSQALRRPTAEKPGRPVDRKPRGSWPSQRAEPPAPGKVGTVTPGPAAVQSARDPLGALQPAEAGRGSPPRCPSMFPAPPSPTVELGLCGLTQNNV